MPDIAIQWDRASLARIDSVIRQEIALMNKEPAEAVKHAYIVFCQSGRAAAKPGKRLRFIFPNPNRRNPNRRSARGRPEKPWLLQFLYQNKPPRLSPAASRSDPRRVIARRGSAHASWGWMMHAVSSTAPNEPNRLGVPKRAIVQVQNQARSGRTDPYIAFANWLVYLLKAYPGIGERAMNKAANRMQHMLNGRLRAEMVRLFHS